MSPTPPPTHRQPLRRARRHQRGRTPALHRPLSRLAAAILLVLVIAGPPALLLALTGNPLDPPNALRSTDALTQQLDDQTVVYLLALAAWLCWLHLLICLITETLHQLRGLRIRTPSPGLFSGNALLASHLVAAVLLSGSHSTLTPAPQAQTTLLAATIDPTHLRTPGIATSAVTDRPQAPAVDRAAPQASPRQDARTTAALTTARGSDGTHEAILCRVLPPQGRHHDTLWDIAERHLGDGMRWRDIYALNQGRLMPDGHRLTRASLIRPGWILQLPGDATALAIDQVLDEPPTDNPPTKPAEQHQPPAVNATPAIAAPPAAAPAAAPRQGEEPSATSRHDDPQAAPEREPSHREVPPREEMTPASPALTSSRSSSTVTSAPSEPSATSDTPSSDTSRIEIAAGLGTLLLGAAALLRSLTRRRKLAARRRPPGVRHTRPAPELLNAERQLRRDARVAEDIAATLRLALLVAATESSGGVAAPQVKAVWEHPDGSLELVLHDHLSDLDGRASAPAPFETTARGWRLTPEGQRYLFAVRLNGIRRQDRTARLDQQLQASPDPFPLLIPVGSQDGSACLVNLEPLGLISIDTDAGVTAQTDPDRPDHRQLIVAAWAQALAGAPWAELTELYVPHTWVQLITGLSRAHTHDFTLHTSDSLLASDSSAEATSLNLTRGPQPLPAQQRERYASSMTLEAARRTGTGGADAHRLTLSLGYPSGQLPTWLVHAALDPRDPNLALVIGPHPQAHRWTLAHDGTLAIPGIADRLIPLQLSPDEHGLLLRLLEHAEDPPHAAPDDPDRADLLAQCLPDDSEAPSAEGDDPNSEQSPGAGLEDELTGAADNDPRAGTGGIPDAVIDLMSYPASPGTSSEPERPGAAEGRPPTSAAAPRLTPDDEATRAAEPIEEHIAEHIAKAAEAADEVAHEEVAAEVGSAPVVPAVLPPGPVEVCVLGPLEVHGSTGAPPRKQALDVLVHLALHRRPVPAEVLFEAVWPNSGYNSRTLRNRVSEVRGYIAPGVDHVRGGYLLPDLVQTDWQRFQSLARGDTDAQLAALQLVRGRPFDGSTLEWMHLEGHFAEMEAAIVDLALEVGERALRDKQYETARTACYAGLRGCPYDERIYRVGMEAAAALGATAEVRELRRRLDLILEEEVDDDIQPATEALYRRLQNEDELRARRHQRHA